MIISTVIDPVLFVRWKDACQASDVAMIKERTEAAHREVGDRLVYLSIISVGVPPPDADTRAALRDGTQHASRHCRSIHIVIEGEGLRRALIRSVSAGILLASRSNFKIHSTAREALEEARKVVDFDVDAVIATADRKGFLSGS